MATRIPLSSFWISFVAALLLTAVLVYVYAEFGLTALLTAAMMSAVLPAALFSLMHFTWMPVASLMLVITAIAPIPLGLIGIRRDDEAEEGPLPLPGFARRLEEENRLKYEMDLLARMQLGLLPKEMPVIEGYEVAARSILATEAGGDLYDFVNDSNGRIWIAAGDVSGHGYSCAIAQAMTKAGLASLVEADRTPAIVLQRLDLVLRGIGSPRTFTSMLLLRLDPPTGDVLVSNAGHPYPWIAQSADVREMDLPSLPLGLGPDRQYADTPLSMRIGTTIVLFSDGLFEATDAHGRAYGFDRLRELLGKVSRRPATAIVTAIVEDWRAHVGSGAPADDTTIVVVKRVG
jgi:sigma-B regulation protein RsbU (phosphoserine phosphatase)